MEYAGKIEKIMKSKKSESVLFKIGVVLLITACLLWIGIVIIPFLPLSSLTQASIVGVLFIVGEIAFWLGTVLAGKEFVTRYKHYCSPKRWSDGKKNIAK